MQNAAAVPPGATGTANRVVDAFTSNPRRFHRHRDPGGPGESHAACHAMRYLLSSIHPVRDPRNLSPPRSGYSYSRPRPDRRPHTVGAIPSQGRSRYSPPSTAPAGSLATRPATTSLTWGLDSLPSASGGGGRGAHSGGEHVGGGGGDLFPAGPLREGEEDPQHDGNNGFPGTLSKRFGSAAAMATAAATAAVAAPSHGCGLTELQSGATASAWGRGGPDCWARANFLLRRLAYTEGLRARKAERCRRASAAATRLRSLQAEAVAQRELNLELSRYEARLDVVMRKKRHYL